MSKNKKVGIPKFKEIIMIIDLKGDLKELNGKVLCEKKAMAVAKTGEVIYDEGIPMTFKQVVCDALNSLYQDEEDITATQKAERGWLAQKIWESKGSIEFTIAEVKTIQDLVGKRYSPLIIAQVFLRLDPPKDSKKK